MTARRLPPSSQGRRWARLTHMLQRRATRGRGRPALSRCQYAAGARAVTQRRSKRPSKRSASEEPPWISQSSGARSTTSRISRASSPPMLPRASASSIDSSSPARTARSSVSRSHSTSRPSSGSIERTSSSRVVFSSQAAPSSPSRTIRWSVAWKPSPGNASRCSHGSATFDSPYVRAPLRELDADEHRGGQAERAQREQPLRAAAHATALRPKTSPEIPASTAKSAERRERGAEGPRQDGLHRLRAASRGPRRRPRRRRTVLLEGPRQVGNLALGNSLELPVEIERDRDLGGQRKLRVEDHRGRVQRRGLLRVVQLGREERRDGQEPDDEPDVADADRGGAAVRADLPPARATRASAAAARARGRHRRAPAPGTA